jgi:hypothetical protein
MFLWGKFPVARGHCHSINNKQKNNMATKSIKKLAGQGEIGGLNTSRYEKAEVAFGVIAVGDYNLADIAVFDDVRSHKIIEARITAHTESPVTLEINPGTDLTNPILLNYASHVKVSYVIHYVRGSGKVGAGPSEGDLLKVILGVD